MQNKLINLLQDARIKYSSSKCLRTTLDLGVVNTVVTAENASSKAIKVAEQFYKDMNEFISFVVQNQVKVGGYYGDKKQRVKISYEDIYSQTNSPSIKSIIIDGDIVISVAADGEISAVKWIEVSTI